MVTRADGCGKSYVGSLFLRGPWYMCSVAFGVSDMYLILGWGGVVGGVSDPQNGKIQKVPRVLFEDKMRYFFTILMTFR